jgi:phenylalanine-4-hydroxylase
MVKSFKTPPPHPTQSADYVPARADWLIDQNWESYSSEDHQIWAKLYKDMLLKLPGKSSKLFQAGIERLQLDATQIPNFVNLSARLKKYAGFEVVAVPGLIPDLVFFEHLANRRFPAGCEIRQLNGLDFQEYPDVFHDIFGHVALLAFDEIADFMEACGKAAVLAHKKGMLEYVARLYWFIIEVGLLYEDGNIVSIGAAINSSEKELNFALKDASPNRIQFDLERVMRTDFWIYDLQSSYFVLDDIKQLKEVLTVDWDSVMTMLEKAPIIELGAVVDADRVISFGDGSYHAEYFAGEEVTLAP